MRKTIIIISLILAMASTARAQGFVETEYISTSDMNDKDGNNHCRGDMLRVRGRYMLIASLGAGVYAMPSEIGWESVLANGAAIFAYKFSDNLSAGFGVGLTNSYGVPLIMPMGYLDWRTNGNVKVQVSMAGGMTIKASTMFCKWFGLELTAIEIDGMSAVRRIDSDTKIYSTMMMRSTLSPTFHINKKMKLRLGIGGRGFARQR